MSRTHIIFNATSLEHALSSVRGLHDMSTELIAEEVFQQMSELTTHKLTPATIWCGHGGLYQSQLEAIRNGEQRIDSAILVDTPDLAGLAIDMHEALNHMREERDDLSAKLDRFYQRSHGIKNLSVIEQLNDELAKRDALFGRYGDTLRPFVELMRKELEANSHKGDREGWLRMSEEGAWSELDHHIIKLTGAETGELRKEHAADVANCCMMLLDILGLLPTNAKPIAIACQVDEGYGQEAKP